MFSIRPHFRFFGDKEKATTHYMRAWKFANHLFSAASGDLKVKGPFSRRFNDGTEYRVMDMGNGPQVDIFSPPKVSGLRTEEEFEIPSFVGARFAPGFCVVDPGDSSGESRQQVPSKSDVAVCISPKWDGFFVYGPGKTVPYKEGDVVEYMGFDMRKAVGLPVISGSGQGNFETDSDSESSLSDTQWQPGPYPHKDTYDLSDSCSFVAYALDEMPIPDPQVEYYCMAYGAVCEYFLNVTSSNMSYWSGFTKNWIHFAVGPASYSYVGICRWQSQSRTHYVIGCKEGISTLDYFSICGKSIEARETRQRGSLVCLMGCLFGGATCGSVDVSTVFEANKSRAQTRTHERKSSTIVKIQTTSGGMEITSTLSTFSLIINFSNPAYSPDDNITRIDKTESITSALYLSTDDSGSKGVSYDGGIVEGQCYFCIYTRESTSASGEKSGTGRDAVNWGGLYAPGPRYLSEDTARTLLRERYESLPDNLLEEYYLSASCTAGIYYNHGKIALFSNDEFDSYEEAPIKKEFIVNVMGVDVVIDSIEYAGDEDVEYCFESLHSNIFGSAENPIFMYSYCLIKKEDSDSFTQSTSGGIDYYAWDTSYSETIEYVRYGYFVGDATTHFRSRPFQTAGKGAHDDYEYTGSDIAEDGTGWQESVTDSYFVEQPFHDVFGLSESTGKYACGLCSAFLIQDDTEKI